MKKKIVPANYKSQELTDAIEAGEQALKNLDKASQICDELLADLEKYNRITMEFQALKQAMKMENP